MRLSRGLIALVGALLLGGVALGAEDVARTPEKPGVAPVKPKGLGVTMAVTALQKEFAAYVKDAKNNKLRDKSDYFKQNPSADATPEMILKALEGSVSGG